MPVFTKKRVFVAIALLLVAGAAATYYQRENNKAREEEPKYKTAVVDKGNITQTVTASGTLNPVALINVGSQVSGTVVELKADRNQKLVTQNYISGTAMDQAKREVEVADANIKLARAQLDRVKADLNNSVIRSPIDGVIIKRTIDMGQTVAASFQTPNLFQIARDLTKMQIDTSVSEADVGSLKDGLPARFVVDAYPDREFEAKLRQFRLAANVQQNVVTYNVVLDVDNKDELLKPGMTAQVRLVVGSRENVVRIPTAALRYKPSEEEQAKEAKALKDKEKKASGSASSAASASANLPAPDVDDDVAFRTKKDLTRTFKLYKLEDKNQAKTVDVKIGLSNFKYTEVISGDLKPGDKVITRALDKAG
ncbi:MAG: efflux RND transporter periplasmic adaptor subunit, partial [Burkholderiales bacterium]|nr:efflux RND transporter periplasmic adaptor subunit [Burkholderiales bacterium]